MFRTTIREWMLLVVIVAVGTCWWVDSNRWQQRLNESGKLLSEARQELAVSEQYRGAALRANGELIHFLESNGYGVDFPTELYVARRPKK